MRTPEPVAYLEERHGGLLGLSFFISVQCPYAHRLYEVNEMAPEQYEPLAKALALFTAHMHDQQVLHCDYSPGNILWDRKADGAYCFSIVDINRMRFGAVTMVAGCKSFARLWGPKRFIQLLVEEYARLRGFDPQVCVETTMQARRRFWTHYQKKREMEFKLEL